MDRNQRGESTFAGMCFFMLASAASIGFAATARGGEIVGLNWFSGVASVAGDIIMAPSAPNNDNQVGVSPNLVQVLQKNYVGIGTVDLVFDVVDTGGTTEYRINEGVANNTGIGWTGYHIELGYGIGGGFVDATPGGGLDFDSPDYDSPVTFGPAFPSFVVTELDIFATGGLPNTGFAGGIVFHIDVPDGITQFTLRQSPIPLPEPATALLLLGACGILRRRPA